MWDAGGGGGGNWGWGGGGGGWGGEVGRWITILDSGS